MTVKDMFYKRESKPGSTLGAAVPDIDPVEALGQPRQVFARDTLPAVAYGY